MKRHILFLNFLCLSLLLGLPFTLRAQNTDSQTIVDPLTVSGTAGTQVISSWNSNDQYYSTPFSTTAYANMTFNLYRVSIPVSLNFINTSAEQFKFSKPDFTISVRPTWNKFTLYFGTSCMNFSNYTYNGISFNGVGMEYRGNNFRFGGFYGTFNRRTKFNNTLNGHDAIQYFSDDYLYMNNVAYTTLPQYERKAYAAHVAIGNYQHYLDFSVLHAADDLNSLPEEWYLLDTYDTTLFSRDSLYGKENLAMGMKAHFALGESVTFESNLGVSLFTPDISREDMVFDAEGKGFSTVNELLGTVRKTKLFNPRFGSEFHFAGDALLNVNLQPVNATFTYRFVQPDYTSLGANGFNQNSQTVGGNVSTSLFHHTAYLNLNGYLQRDNLDKKQLFTNQVGAYSASWNNFIGESVALSLMYYAVMQKQLDGVLEVPEDTRIDQLTQSFDFSPSYTLSLDNDHTFSLNFNYLQSKNLNKLMDAMSFNITTTSYGVGYEVYLTGLHLSLDANYDYSLSRSPGNDYSPTNDYKSHSLTCGTNYNFIEKEDMVLSGNARLVTAFNIMETEQEELTDSERKVLNYLARRTNAKVGSTITNDLSVAASLGASLNYKDRHNASIYFAVSNYSDNVIVGQHVAVDTDLRVMLEYSYTFASRLIKSKKR